MINYGKEAGSGQIILASEKYFYIVGKKRFIITDITDKSTLVVHFSPDPRAINNVVWKYAAWSDKHILLVSHHYQYYKIPTGFQTLRELIVAGDDIGTQLAMEEVQYPYSLLPLRRMILKGDVMQERKTKNSEVFKTLEAEVLKSYGRIRKLSGKTVDLFPYAEDNCYIRKDEWAGHTLEVSNSLPNGINKVTFRTDVKHNGVCRYNFLDKAINDVCISPCGLLGYILHSDGEVTVFDLV